MALLFTVMLGLSAGILAFLVYVLAPGSLNSNAQQIFEIFALIIVVLMVGVVLASFFISHFVVSRINRIAGTAQNIIDTGDLSKRISIDTKWDDLSNLAQVLNGFLAQIDGLMSGVREVSNNIAHDLRTPLTGLRSDIEQLKGKTVTDEDLDGLLEEADRILKVFHSLLRISNIEKGKRHQTLREVHLDTVLNDVIELYEPVAEEKQIALINDISRKLLINGDADLLFQLFANLIDNALKFTGKGSHVKILAHHEGAHIKVLIQDAGPGIPDEEKGHVFRHFYRTDQSRGSEGYGLGLSLVKAVVNKHRGRIVLEDGNPGLKVSIFFKPYQ